MNKNHLRLPVISSSTGTRSSFEKCIRDNYCLLREEASLSETDCFRIYDQELAQYPVVIEYYAGRFSIQYFPPTRIDSELPIDLAEEISKTLCMIFKTGPDFIYLRTHTKTKSTRQYEKAADLKEFFTAMEHGLKFKINLTDYLDTGLFLDHRETRRIVAANSKGKRVLNLFAYTCSFSVHAAASGASFTKSVDLSNTYTDWGRDNFILNSLPLKNNEVVRADCLKFLPEEVRSGRKYDIIIIDPPTISRSKKMDRMLDVQKDYVFLISKGMELLNPSGTLYFSTNSRKFNFDEKNFHSCLIEEITDRTIPSGFKDKKIHRCWTIKKDKVKEASMSNRNIGS